jgi:hypothetical protein
MRFSTLASVFALLLVAACSSATPETGTGDTKSGDSKSGDTKSGDSKSGDSKSGDTKSDEPGATEPPPSKSSGKDLGGICAKDADCESNLCVFKGSSPRGVCTMQCNNVTDCPGGFTRWDDCAEVGNVTGQVCIPKT